MQQTKGSTCQYIKVSPTEIGLLATKPDSTCKADYAGESTSVLIKHDDVIFTISEGLSSFSFSQLGKPLGCITADPCFLTLTVSGESGLDIEINAEGYIHAKHAI
jgi:MSHA pilin protein MshC